MTDTTLVTGGPGGRALREGDVLAERYAIVEALEGDALVLSFRALDQQTGDAVLVRAIAPGLVGDRDARGVFERLRALVGVGRRILSPLRDVARDSVALVITIEPWPRGTSLREVLDARRRRGGSTALEARELLPVVARLGAALASIPEPHWHGDVRAERVWIDSDGLVLTGGFAVSSMPGEIVAPVLQRAPELRRALAPEVAEGLGGRASDRWAVAAIAWEALTGRALGHDRVQPPARLGAVGVELARLLHPDPSARPARLDALIAALAALARLPIPRVEPDPHPALAAGGALDPDEATLVGPTHPTTDASHRPSTIPAPPPDGAEPGTDPVGLALHPAPASALDSEERTSTDPRIPFPPQAGDILPPPRDAAEDLDPRLVRAALAPEPEASIASGELELLDGKTDPGLGEGPTDELDPRLVRAALGTAVESGPPSPPPVKRSTPMTRALAPAEVEAPRPPASVPARPAIAAVRGPASSPGRPAIAAVPAPSRAASALSPSARSGPTPVAVASAAQAIPAPPSAAAAPAQPAAIEPSAPRRARRPLKEPEPVPVPVDIKPIPRPRTRDSGEMVPVGPVLFDASKSSPRITPPAAPPPSSASEPASARASGALRTGAADAMPRRQSAPRRARSAPSRGSLVSWFVIVGIAAAIAIAIVRAGFWYRDVLQREAERQQRIEQRLREIQRTTP